MEEEDIDEEELKQKGLENLILLVLGENKEKISVLHLEKEMFLLWNFHPQIKSYLKFIKYYRGPFSREIQESAINPIFCEKCWVYIPPNKADKLSGGYVKITETGIKEYNRIYAELKKDDEILHLLTGIKLVRRLYSKLSLEELLLLIYTTYPEYIRKSHVYNDISKNKEKLLEKLLEKKLIDEDRYKSILIGE